MSEQFERRRPPRFLADLLNSHVDFHTLYKAVLKHKDTIKLNRLVYMSSFNLQALVLSWICCLVPFITSYKADDTSSNLKRFSHHKRNASQK